MEPLPIAELSFIHARWTIKARVTSKSRVRKFAKGNEEGKVFSIDLLDKFGGEIKATFFNQGADKFEELLQVGNCYVFSRGNVKIANRQYNSCNHRYEITFDKDAIVSQVAEDTEIQSMKLTYIDLRSLQQKTLPTKVDLVGIVTDFKAAFPFTSKDGKELVKRDLVLADDTATSMQVTIWGERAMMPDEKFAEKPVIAMKGVVVKEWNDGRSGSLISEGALIFEPKDVDGDRIRSWWKDGGSAQSIAALSRDAGAGNAMKNAVFGSLAEVRNAADVLPDQPVIINAVVRLATVQTRKQGEPQPLTYLACSNPREKSTLLCNRRVNDDGVCPACGSVGKGVARLNIRCQFVDYSNSAWITTFHEGAQQVLGMQAEQVLALERENSQDDDGKNSKLNFALKERYYNVVPMQVTIRAKADVYNGEKRANISCIDAKFVNRAEHGKRMLNEIQAMLGCDDFL